MKGKNKLEDLVVEYLKELDSKARPTKASGGGIRNSEKGDIYNELGLIIECKQRNKENIVIERKVWNKLLNEIPIGQRRIPIIVYQNKYKENFVILSLEDFINLLNGGIDGQ